MDIQSSSKTEPCTEILEEKNEDKTEVFESAKKVLEYDFDEICKKPKNLFSNTQSPYKSNFRIVSQKNSPAIFSVKKKSLKKILNDVI